MKELFTNVLLCVVALPLLYTPVSFVLAMLDSILF
ncbi:hypothetical protein VPHPS32B4_0074 [Vibrio phage PS32B-4]